VAIPLGAIREPLLVQQKFTVTFMVCPNLRAPSEPISEELSMATETGQEYLCEVCGNKVKVIESGGGELTCCGQAMTLQ